MAVVSPLPVASCAVCAAIERASGTLESGTWLVAYVDDVLIAFVQPQTGAALVAPRAHVSGLSTSPTSAGEILAGLRRAMLAVRTFSKASGSTVQPMIDVPGSAGHICYKVVATLPALAPLRSAPTPREPTLSRHVAAAMRPVNRDCLRA